MKSWHVGVAAEAFAAAQFARYTYDVSVQYGANQPEYDLIALHEDWECVGFVIDKSKRSGLDRPDLSEIVEKMENGEIKYIVVTHLSVIHPNLSILQKFADKLKGIGCGIVSLYERVNTLYLTDTIRNTILPKDTKSKNT